MILYFIVVTTLFLSCLSCPWPLSFKRISMYFSQLESCHLKMLKK
jgi:hypothetical protein